MIAEELCKRPFMRPLIVWIAGIIIAVYHPYAWWIGISVLGVDFLLLLYSAVKGSKDRGSSYASRWFRGTLVFSLYFCISILYTSYRLGIPPLQPFDWQLSAKLLQMSLSETFSHLNLSQKEQSVLSTLVLGYRESMNRELTEQFTAAGVVHILSVSGFHVAVLYSLFSWLFSFIGKSTPVRCLDAGVTLALVWGFTIISGLDTPTVRSAIMITFYCIGYAFRLHGDNYNTWAASAFLMLCYNPFYFFDIGFQLSYIAVFSIQFFYPRLRKLQDIRNPIVAIPWNGLMLTIAAQIGTLPLCMYYFREISWVFIYTSLPVSWIASLMIPLGLLWALLDVCQIPCSFIAPFLEASVRGLIFFVEGFGRIPMLHVQFNGWMLLVSYLILFAAMYYWATRRKPLSLGKESRNRWIA